MDYPKDHPRNPMIVKLANNDTFEEVQRIIQEQENPTPTEVAAQ